jgi:hypothetical protein
VNAINVMLFVVLHGQAKSNHSAERPHQNQRFPDSPDLVVKPQAIDIMDFILWLVLRPRVVYQREITGRAALNM